MTLDFAKPMWFVLIQKINEIVKLVGDLKSVNSGAAMTTKSLMCDQKKLHNL